MYQIIIKDRHKYTGPGIYCGRAMPSYGLKESVLRNRCEGETRLKRVAEYRRWLWKQMHLGEAVYRELKRIAELVMHEDVFLICWCEPLRCHLEIVRDAVYFLNSPDGKLWEQKMLSKLAR